MQFFLNSGYSDDDVISILKRGDEKAINKVVQFLYSKNWKKVLSYVKKNSGTEDDASDIFQEVLVLFYNQVQVNKFKGNSLISTYLMGIAKNLWLTSLKKSSRTEQPLTVEEEGLQETSPEEEINNFNLFYQLFDRLSSECQKILKLAYFDDLTMQEIQMQFDGLSNVQSAKTKKYRCLKNLMGVYKENSISIENFYV